MDRETKTARWRKRERVEEGRVVGREKDSSKKLRKGLRIW